MPFPLVRHAPASLVALALVLPAPATAQVKASEPASISQTVDGTTIMVEYSRPRVRGRDSIFGGEVKWEEVWTPGANWATTLEVGKDVKLNGHPLAKGKYSLWMVVRPETWTMVLDPRARMFHTRHPDSTPEQLRFDVTPETGPFTEVLAFSFPEIRLGGTTLVMQWGTVRVPLRIDVPPSYRLELTSAEVSPYLGTWEMRWRNPNWGDTTAVIPFALTHRDGTLHGEWLKEPWPDAEPFVLIPTRDRWFRLGLMEKGELYEIFEDMTFEFGPAGGRAKSFEMRGDKDDVVAAGQRGR